MKNSESKEDPGQAPEHARPRTWTSRQIIPKVKRPSSGHRSTRGPRIWARLLIPRGRRGSGPRKHVWIGHRATGAAGLFLLLIYAALPSMRHAGTDLLDEAAGGLLRDLGIALMVAAVVARLFDTVYHEKMFGDPVRDLKTSVNETTADLRDRTRRVSAAIEKTVWDMRRKQTSRDTSLRKQYDQMVESLSLLSRSSALGVVGFHERNHYFREELGKALRSAEQHCWIVGRTHKEMLGAQDEGKGWLVEDLERKLKARPDFSLRILLANPFDPVLEPSQTDIEVDRTVPRTRNPARVPLHGFEDARKAIYQILDTLKPHQTIRPTEVNQKNRRIEVKLLRTFAVPYCMLMTEERVFVEHYLPSREGGALFITSIVRKDQAREQAPYDCFRSDFNKLFEHGEDCDTVLERFKERKIDQYSDDPRGLSVEHRYPGLEQAIKDARALNGKPEELTGEADSAEGGVTPSDQRYPGLEQAIKDARALNGKREQLMGKADSAEGVVTPSDFRSNRVTTDQQTVYADVIRYIKGHRGKIKTAIVLQYSAVKVEDVLIALMDAGATIYLFVQSPKIADPEMKMQSARIQAQRSHLPKVLIRRITQGKCKIFEYRPRATLRGILIPGHLLALGPYIYQASPTSFMEADPFPDDRIEIKGHDAPGMLYWYDSPEYRVFCDAYLDLVENYARDTTAQVRTIPDDFLPPQERSDGQAAAVDGGT
ncbi:hypothetical protein OKW45_006644 [Paraburkholderia sp. WSM4175]|uniref:hypothetical protein n=1 Tax=Paraburkholderia sp. WSM4175 TaxID=2991072 RepID=UPI003D1B2FCF